jgi:hypothetical protein
MSDPKVFISYAWTSAEHIAWVVALASELTENGVEVVLDKWHLREGHDANAFMESMVVDPSVTKVVMVCDEAYAAKANKRAGGVGTEAQIISPKLYAQKQQDKFVAVVREKDAEGNAHLPIFYGARIHIDMSDEAQYSANFEQLLRWVYDKPAYIKPAKGKRPEYLDAAPTSRVGSNSLFRQAVEGLKRAAPNALLVVEEYFESVLAGFEAQRIEPFGPVDELDDKVLASIAELMPTRNELVEVFGLVARTHDNDDGRATVARFLEALAKMQRTPDSVSQFNEGDWDNFRYIAWEIFLHTMAALLKRERFGFAASLLNAGYFELERHSKSGKVRNYTTFWRSLPSLERRKQRLQLNRYSLAADLIKERCSGSGIDFTDIQQADFVLYVRYAVEATNTQQHIPQWYPVTLGWLEYRAGPFEVFVKAVSAAYFARLAPVFGVKKASELQAVLAQFAEGKVNGPSFGYAGDYLPVADLANMKALAVKP